MMKKLFALLCALTLSLSLLTACSSGDASSSSAAPDSSSTAAASTMGPNTKLQNAEQAGIMQPGETLDMYEMGDDTTTPPTHTLIYPSEWPAAAFGEYLPEYTGEGWLFLLIYSAEEEGDYENSIMASVSIYGYQEADLDAYIEEILALGYEEIEVTAEELAALDPGTTERQFMKGDNLIWVDMMTDPDWGANVDLTIAMGDRVQ